MLRTPSAYCRQKMPEREITDGRPIHNLSYLASKSRVSVWSATCFSNSARNSALLEMADSSCVGASIGDSWFSMVKSVRRNATIWLDKLADFHSVRARNCRKWRYMGSKLALIIDALAMYAIYI